MARYSKGARMYGLNRAKHVVRGKRLHSGKRSLLHMVKKNRISFGPGSSSGHHDIHTMVPRKYGPRNKHPLKRYPIVKKGTNVLSVPNSGNLGLANRVKNAQHGKFGGLYNKSLSAVAKMAEPYWGDASVVFEPQNVGALGEVIDYLSEYPFGALSHMMSGTNPYTSYPMYWA